MLKSSKLIYRFHNVDQAHLEHVQTILVLNDHRATSGVARCILGMFDGE